jgi:hypothetical protein
MAFWYIRHEKFVNLIPDEHIVGVCQTKSGHSWRQRSHRLRLRQRLKSFKCFSTFWILFQKVLKERTNLFGKNRYLTKLVELTAVFYTEAYSKKMKLLLPFNMLFAIKAKCGKTVLPNKANKIPKPFLLRQKCKNLTHLCSLIYLLTEIRTSKNRFLNKICSAVPTPTLRIFKTC